MKKMFFTLLWCFLFCFLGIATIYSQNCGDINADGSTNIVDALIVSQCYVGLISCPSADIGDVNCDGSINIVDALLISQLYVSLISTLNCCAVTPAPTPAATPAATTLPGSGTPPPYGVTNPPVITQPPGGTPIPDVTPDPDETDFFYFSYDDSASTASVELAKYNINNGVDPDPGLARPWEFLNFEEFVPSATTNIGLFDVSMGLWERDALKEGNLKSYKLGVYLASPVITKEERNNTVLTLLLDVSGSMRSQTIRVDNQTVTRMDLLKACHNQCWNSLKEGDVINIVTFESTASIAYQGLTVPGDFSTYDSFVQSLTPLGSTALAQGIYVAYQAALATYDPAKSNRVIILTDAFANTGVIDPAIIAENVIINDQEGIHFSGIGISLDFNEAFLNELTDAGKGAYFTIATYTDAARAFSERFISLLSLAAKDVKFRMDYPAILEHDVTAAEETSTDPVEVQPTNFSYNTSQYFFEGFLLESGEVLPETTFKLTVTYNNPSDGVEIVETYEKTITELLGIDNSLIRDAETIYLFTQLFGLHKEWGEIGPVFTTFYDDYSSAIYDEYWDLIKKFIGDEFVVIPDPIAFGSVLIGDMLTKNVTVANNTIDPVEIYEIYLENTDPLLPFSITQANPVTLGSMEVLNLQVSFASDIEGSYTNNLVVDSSHSDSPLVVEVTGIAISDTDTPTPTPVGGDTPVPTPLPPTPVP